MDSFKWIIEQEENSVTIGAKAEHNVGPDGGSTGYNSDLLVITDTYQNGLVVENGDNWELLYYEKHVGGLGNGHWTITTTGSEGLSIQVTTPNGHKVNVWGTDKLHDMNVNGKTVFPVPVPESETFEAKMPSDSYADLPDADEDISDKLAATVAAFAESVASLSEGVKEMLDKLTGND